MRRKILKKKEQEAFGSFLGLLILIAILIEVGKHVIEFLSTNYKIFYFILGVTGIVLVGLFRREQIKRKNYLKFVAEWRNYLFSKLKEHEKTLGIKRNQTLRKNSYGFIDQKQKNEWAKEVSTFLVSIQFPSPSLFTSVEMEEFFDLINKISAESANNLVYDAEKVTPKEYEVMCADILKNAGWDASITKASGDQGVDVVAEKNGKKIVFQCKRYSYPVGNKAVQEALAGKSFYGADVAVVVSNQIFTSSAKELAQSTGVLLLHHEMLSDLDSVMRKRHPSGGMDPS